LFWEITLFCENRLRRFEMAAASTELLRDPVLAVALGKFGPSDADDLRHSLAGAC
jgi:hypothetical protein